MWRAHTRTHTHTLMLLGEWLDLAKRSKVKHTEAQLKELLQRRLKEKESLQQLETQIYAMEGGYLQDTQLWGNVFRGWDGYALLSRAQIFGGVLFLSLS
jgi:hypothetical protein